MHAGSFTLTGRDGAEHRYAVTHHPTDEGLEIATELWQRSVPSVVSAFGALLQSDRFATEVSRAIEGTPGGVREMLAMLADVDLHLVGDRLGGVFAGIAPLMRKVLQYTTRDGEPLDKELHFARAYQGNYLELVQAVWRVAVLNGFFPELTGFPTALPESQDAPAPTSA